MNPIARFLAWLDSTPLIIPLDWLADHTINPIINHFWPPDHWPPDPPKEDPTR